MDGLMAGPSHPAEVWASAVQPQVAPVERLAAREEAQSVPASAGSRSGAKASSQGTAALLAHPPGTVNCTLAQRGAS